MIIIDMMMLIRRCYAKMDFLKNDAGVPTGLEFGTLRTIEMLQKKYDQKVILCFDHPHNFKRDEYPSYKANRKSAGEDFYLRLAKFKKFLQCLYVTVEMEGYEADELMFTIAKVNPEQNYVYTNDHDLLQVCDEHNVVVKSFHSKLFEWDAEKVTKEYGVPPYLLAVFFAFTGDKVDNIEGVPRINKKYLASLINWSYENDLELDELVEEICTADWGAKTKEALNSFVGNGQFGMNYRLIKLKLVPKMFAQPPTEDKEFVKECLLYWNIRTLKLCAGYDLLQDEEF